MSLSSLFKTVSMRKLNRFFLCLFAVGAIATLVPDMALAQYGGGGGGGGRGKKEDDPGADEKKKSEWEDKQLDLGKRHADGPCPYVKVLYDAARYIDFDQGKQASGNVKYSGEIEGISSDCAYKDSSPISLALAVGFSFGKGPMAQSSEKTYRYWVAVTERDKRVLAKEYFDLPVSFAPGESVKSVNVKLEDIVIPRAKTTVSGANFEVLIGFDVTPEMAAFNGEGKRFRVLSASETASGAANKPAGQ